MLSIMGPVIVSLMQAFSLVALVTILLPAIFYLIKYVTDVTAMRVFLPIAGISAWFIYLTIASPHTLLHIIIFGIAIPTAFLNQSLVQYVRDVEREQASEDQ